MTDTQTLTTMHESTSYFLSEEGFKTSVSFLRHPNGKYEIYSQDTSDPENPDFKHGTGFIERADLLELLHDLQQFVTETL